MTSVAAPSGDSLWFFCRAGTARHGSSNKDAAGDTAPRITYRLGRAEGGAVLFGSASRKSARTWGPPTADRQGCWRSTLGIIRTVQHVGVPTAKRRNDLVRNQDARVHELRLSRAGLSCFVRERAVQASSYICPSSIYLDTLSIKGCNYRSTAAIVKSDWTFSSCRRLAKENSMKKPVLAVMVVAAVCIFASGARSEPSQPLYAGQWTVISDGILAELGKAHPEASDTFARKTAGISVDRSTGDVYRWPTISGSARASTAAGLLPWCRAMR